MSRRIFDRDRDARPRRVVLPWGRTVAMCLRNVRRRLGRSALTFLCITVVVAFFSFSMGSRSIVSSLSKSQNVHTQALLERSGMLARDAEGKAAQRDRQSWLLALSLFLCLIGITNTILMSVNERVREIGTLKCLGALDGFIVRLFLIENFFIGALASLLGAAIGLLLGLAQIGAAMEFSLLTPGICARGLVDSLPRAVGLGTALTLLACLYPTYVASRMKPVDAMRVEV